MKKKIYFLLTAVLVIATVFSACGSDKPENTQTTPTAAPATKSPAAPTPTAGTETGAPTKEPTEDDKNILYFALSEDAILPPSELQWGPVLPEYWTAPCWNRTIEEVEIDGETVDCLYLTHSWEDGNGQNIGNVFGVLDIIKTNTTYKLTVTLKYTDPTDPTDVNFRDLMYITCNAAAENVNANDFSGSGVAFHAKDEWQTIEYTFTTGDTMPVYEEGDDHKQDPYIMVGPSCNRQRMYGEVSSGIELWISEFSLVEVSE